MGRDQAAVDKEADRGEACDNLVNRRRPDALADWTEYDANDDRTMYFRLQRADGVVSAQRSLDGTTWMPLWTKDYGSALDGLGGRLAIDGIAWFQPMGCYADYDYVRLTNQ